MWAALPCGGEEDRRRTTCGVLIFGLLGHQAGYPLLAYFELCTRLDASLYNTYHPSMSETLPQVSPETETRLDRARTWRRQQNDAIRLDDLALLCRGKIALAAVLAVRQKGVTTVADAAALVERAPDQVNAALNQLDLSLMYCRWIADGMDEIRVLLSKINFELVLTVRGAKVSSNPVFEQVFKDIIKTIEGRNGLLYAIGQIFEHQLQSQAPNTLALKLVSEVRVSVLEIKRLCWRLLHPFVYIITDIRIAGGLLIISVLTIPVWYFFGYHQMALTGTSPTTMVEADVSEFLRKYNQANQSLLSRVLGSVHYVFETALLLPSMFLLPATVLALVRRVLPAGRYYVLKRVEDELYSIGKILQKRLPNPPKGPTVVVGGKVMTGDQYRHYGQGSQGPHSSTNVYMGAWNDMKGNLDLQMLAGELKELRASLKAKSETTIEEDEAIAAVAGAERAAREGDGPGTLERLAKAGQWALKVATDISVKVAAEAITKAMGLK
jgi:hypothetical protein